MTNLQHQPEVWAKVPETFFEVSNHGGLRGFKQSQWRGMVPVEKVPHGHGYEGVRLKSKTIFFHRIIAAIFIPNPENKPFINHIDGDKKNNAVWNLEWCTAQENNRHSYHKLDTDSQYPKRPVNVYKDGKLVYEAFSVRDAARFAKSASPNVTQCCDGRRKQAMGFTFKYKEIGTTIKQIKISRRGLAQYEYIKIDFLSPAGSQHLGYQRLAQGDLFIK